MVLVIERASRSSRASGREETCRSANTRARFSSRTRKSVNGSNFVCVETVEKSVSSRGSGSPHKSRLGFCAPRPATAVLSESAPRMASCFAVWASKSATPSCSSFNSDWMRSTRGLEVAPAFFSTLASTARRWTGIARPQASIARPKTADKKNHTQRLIVNSFHQKCRQLVRQSAPAFYSAPEPPFELPGETPTAQLEKNKAKAGNVQRTL